MSWLELSVDVDQEAVESISDLLAQYGYQGGVAIDQPIIPGEDGPEYTFDTSRPVTLRTYIPLDEQAEDVRSRLEQALWHFGQIRPVGPLQVKQLEEQDWANAWKKYYTINHLGERTVIVPSWLEYDPQPNDIVLRLDPGMAFGTGLHPTTQLCLALMENYVAKNDRVVDLGCGSGILAIQAALLGASHVLALDTDPIAVDATVINAKINDTENLITAAVGSLGKGTSFGHWMGWNTPTPEGAGATASTTPENLNADLIVANILAKVLVAVADDMIVALRPGGLLVSSGIIAEREDEVALAYASVGLERLERRQQGDWVALVHRKPA